MQRWSSARLHAVFLFTVVMAVVGGVSPLFEGSALAAPAPVVEDFAYPDAEGVLQRTGVKVVSGDANLVPIECAPGINESDELIRISGRLAPNGAFYCFKLNGASGYLKLELPEVYNIETAAHEVQFRLRRVVDGRESSGLAPPDTPTCTPSASGCWSPLGEGGSSEEETSVLVEMDVRPPDGNVAVTFPSQVAHPAIGRLNVGVAGRPGSTSCTATLVHPSWVLTAASCFGSGPAVGPPRVPATVSLGGQIMRRVAHLVPRDDRNLVLAKIETEVGGVVPVAVAPFAPTVGQAVTAKGLGRTATEWAPSSVHTAPATITSMAPARLGLASNGPICKGDAGGPIVGGGGNLLAIVTESGQNSCIGAAGTSSDAAAARADNIKTWIDEQIRFSIGYLANPQSNTCVEAVPFESVLFASLGSCAGSWTMRLTWNADGTIRLAQRGICLSVLSDTAGPVNGNWLGFSTTCDGSWKQKFMINSDGSITNSGKCVDLDATIQPAEDSRLIVWDCNQQWNQKWAFRSVEGELRNPLSGRCADIDVAAGYPPPDGEGPVESYDCLGGSNQKWLALLDGTIRNPGSGKCLDIRAPGEQATVSAPVQLWTCNGRWNQKWTVKGDGTVVNPRSGFCIDIQSQSVIHANGTSLVAFPCHGGWNQQWSFEPMDGRLERADLAPVGHLEIATGAQGVIQVGGWAFDPETAASVDVDIWIDGTPVKRIRSDGFRPDIAFYFPLYGPNHGFAGTVNAGPGNHVVCATVRNYGTPSGDPFAGFLGNCNAPVVVS